MSYDIEKITYSDGRAYRYKIVDERGQVRYQVEMTGLSLPTPTHEARLLDAEGEPIGRIEPQPSAAWRWARKYSLLLGDDQEPYATIEEQWTLVDRLLLRLPSYLIRIGEQTYAAQGTRYGDVFYELFRPPPETEQEPERIEEEELPDAEELPEKLAEQERSRRGEKVGEILRPSTGASYVVQAEEAPLRQAPLILAALAILADLHLQEE